MIDLGKYLKILNQTFHNNGLILEHPDKPLEFIKDKSGNIIELEAHRFRIKFLDGNSLDYDELGYIIFGNVDMYEIKVHKYHFNASVEDFHPFRIDLDKQSCHANDYDTSKVKYNPSWPDHLGYPNDIDLNITNFNLILAINTSLIYISTKNYPLENTYATSFNSSNERLRRQLS